MCKPQVSLEPRSREIDIDDLRALLRDARSEIALMRAERAHEDADAEFRGAARALAEVEVRLNALERGGYTVASRVCSRHSERTSRFDCIDGPPT
jgi:hypothetical protein